MERLEEQLESREVVVRESAARCDQLLNEQVICFFDYISFALHILFFIEFCIIFHFDYLFPFISTFVSWKTFEPKI